MKYYTCYDSPIGRLLLIADGECLTEIGFDYDDPRKLDRKVAGMEQGIPDVLMKTITWLDTYFQGERPGELPKMELSGTPFQKKVWEIVAQIPYGQSMSYGAIAGILAKEKGRMSAQAVGNAVGNNPIPILVPCHRVLGKEGKLTGYGGGLEKKKLLLCLELIPYAGQE